MFDLAKPDLEYYRYAEQQWNVSESAKDCNKTVEAWRHGLYHGAQKLLLATDFLSLNNPDHAVALSSSAIAKLKQQETDNLSSDYLLEPTPEIFLSSPRLRSAFGHRTITIDAPPLMQKVETIPLALLLGPALTMGLTAVVMAAVAIINLMNGTSDMLTSAPTLVMSFSMLCGTLLWPLLTKHSEKKRRAEMEAERPKEIPGISERSA